MNEQSSLYEKIIAAVGGVLAMACMWLMNLATARFRRRALKHTRIEKSQGLDIEINVRLDRAMNALGAQRVYLAKYHNGDHYIDGSEIIKISRSHERVRPGVSYQADQFQGRLVSTIVEEVDLVIEAGPSWKKVEDIPEGRFRWLCEQGGVAAIARCKVIVYDRIIGYVGADFGNALKPANIDALCGIAHEIAGLLNSR